MHRSSWLAFIPFALVVLSVAVGLHVYLYRRLVKGMTASRPARAVGAGLFALLGLLIVLGPMSTRMLTHPQFLFVGQSSFLWWALCFYLFVLLGVVDLAAFLTRHVHRHASKVLPAVAVPPPLPESPERRAFLVKTARTVAATAAVGATGFGFGEAWEPARITEVPVKLPRLPSALSGLTLAQLTDVHVGAWIDRRFVEDLVERTNSFKPDAVFITGDLVDGSVRDLRPMVAPLAGLRSRFGTYFVTGNHEYYSGVDAWCSELEGMGMTVLRNRRVSLGDAGASLDLVGVDDFMGGRGTGARADLKAAVAGRDPSRAAVLLAHQPKGVEEAARAGIGLQLSGHTHGGQIWPWSYAVRLAYPYFKGRYEVDGLVLYVSNGCGFWGPPVRVGAPPEIVKVVLG